MMLSMQLTNKKIFFEKKKSYMKKSIKIFYIFFSCKNNFFKGNVLTKLDKMSELNKFEI